MSDIADKIYAATGLTLGAEAAARVAHMIRLARQEAADEIEKLRAALQTARRDALEEAEQAVAKSSQRSQAVAAICALKRKE
jgi:hypothetical protein